MRLAELSERSGVPVATIKYYLREQLLPPGALITAKQADYGEDHLRRLRLVRALIQIGRMPVATAREVLAAIQDESQDQNSRLGAAVGSLPTGPQPDPEDPATVAARREADRLLDELGWDCGRLAEYPPYRTLVSALAALARLGYPYDTVHLAPYARAAEALAVCDLDLVEEYQGTLEQVEAAVALTVLYEPVLLSLRRLAQAQESERRFVMVKAGGRG
ncbi:MerR family transcriptional regulator [Kitasatospora sp. NBC_01266]|uniref:MerR family transcriptional regulator n=1 Tax=Kitasatospora sp. NBC_01266 TaxID=2903572 RepID=UPI002E33CEC5|nr:MerR family transcriptional regulator [Kitasatospora sp. NBC_01266]